MQKYNNEIFYRRESNNAARVTLRDSVTSIVLTVLAFPQMPSSGYFGLKTQQIGWY